MSQSAITDRSRENDWERWYVGHLAIMAGVPGIDSAQRFKTSSQRHPPSLAMYSIRSAAVFSDAYYLSVRGMGEWLPLVDRRWYRRNLFDGLDVAPYVAPDEALLLVDTDSPVRGRADVPWTWLECVGLDRSTPYRGIAVVPSAEAPKFAASDIAIYLPATQRVTSH